MGPLNFTVREVRVKPLVLFGLVSMTCAGAVAQPRADSVPPEVTSWIKGYATSLKSPEGTLPYYYPDATRLAKGALGSEPATAVVFTLEGFSGGNNYVQYLTVFWKRGGHYVYCCTQRVGGKGIRSVETVAFSGGKVQIGGKEYVSGTDPMCCPSKPYTEEFAEVNSQLAETARTSNNHWRGP